MKARFVGNIPKQDLLIKILKKMVKQYNLENVDETVTIKVVPSNRMPHHEAPAAFGCNTDGYCRRYPNRKGTAIHINADRLREEGSVADLSNLIECFAHEFCHFKQYAKREMVHKDDGSIIFKGKRYSPEVLLRCARELRPQAVPWEKEAYKVGFDMAVEVMNELGYSYDPKLDRDNPIHHPQGPSEIEEALVRKTLQPMEAMYA